MTAVAEWYKYRIVAGHVTSSSPVPLKTRRVGQRCRLNLSRAETSSRDGRQDVEDDSPPGHPSTSKTDENVEKAASLIRSDRRLSIRAIANNRYNNIGTRFESVEAVKEKTARVLKELTKDDFQHCFQQWKIRMERCRDREGVYIESDNK
ncbi:FLJ37770-like protein [Trichonephila clavipes]|nr:FLJ37770-like protein [Trichonephila clavipes]